MAKSRLLRIDTTLAVTLVNADIHVVIANVTPVAAASSLRSSRILSVILVRYDARSYRARLSSTTNSITRNCQSMRSSLLLLHLVRRKITHGIYRRASYNRLLMRHRHMCGISSRGIYSVTIVDSVAMG